MKHRDTYSILRRFVPLNLASILKISHEFNERTCKMNEQGKQITEVIKG